MKIYIVATPWDSTQVADVQAFKTKEMAKSYVRYREENPRNGYVPSLWIEEVDLETLGIEARDVDGKEY